MAQLMLHRDVLKSFGKLPVKVQRKSYELIRKFEEDSQQLSIHLEPVQNARDSKVRSARVGDDYRAIVIAPDRGDTFLLMHIDHHDEAYAWCKHRQFETHAALGTLQVFDIEAVERVVEQQTQSTPRATTSYILDHLSDSELFAAGVPQALIPAVRAVREDTAFEQLSHYLPAEATQVLYGVIMGMGLDEALAEMLGIDRAHSSIPAVEVGDFSHLVTAANSDLVLVEGEEHLRAILAEDIEAWRIFLHPYQRKLVEWGVTGAMKLYGAAGTGKTVALLHRAAWLAQQGELQVGEAILITTFTSNLAITLKGLIEKLAPNHHAVIEVTPLHQLARTVLFRGGWRGKVVEEEDLERIWEEVLGRNSSAPLNPALIRTEFAQMIEPMGIDNEEGYLSAVRTGRPRLQRAERKQVWAVVAQLQQELMKRNLLTLNGVIHQARLAIEAGKFQRYRHVLVDELQDFGLEALRLIAALSPLAEDKTNPLCLVGDGHQRLYNRLPVPLSRAGIDVRGRSRRLKINYRTSEQIRLWAHAQLHAVEIDDLDGGRAVITGDRSVFSGPEPQVVRAESLEALVEPLYSWIEQLMQQGFARHEICITPIHQTLMGALEQRGVATLELRPRERDPGQAEQGIRYGSRERIKGLEFRAVALILDLTQQSAEMEWQRYDRFATYVAATRAREQLLVLEVVAG